MAGKTNTTNALANAMNGGAKTLNPELNSVSGTNTEIPDVNGLATAMARSNGTYGENSPTGIYDEQLAKQAGHDSPKTKAEVLAEQKAAEELRAHLAPLEKNEKYFIELFNSRKEEDKVNKLAVERQISDLIASGKKVTIGRNELETAVKASLPDSNRSIEEGGGKGWQNYFAILTTWIQQLQKRINSAKNLDWNGASKAKAKKKKGPGEKIAGATNAREMGTAIHEVNNENAAWGE